MDEFCGIVAIIVFADPEKLMESECTIKRVFETIAKTPDMASKSIDIIGKDTERWEF